jgi:hypothetical protein
MRDGHQFGRKEAPSLISISPLLDMHLATFALRTSLVARGRTFVCAQLYKHRSMLTELLETLKSATAATHALCDSCEVE